MTKDIIQEITDDFFSLPPKHRTKKKLYEFLDEAYAQGHASGVIMGCEIEKIINK